MHLLQKQDFMYRKQITCAIRNRIFGDRIIDANCFLIGIFHVIEGNVKCTFYNFRYAQPILITPLSCAIVGCIYSYI